MGSGRRRTAVGMGGIPRTDHHFAGIYFCGANHRVPGPGARHGRALGLNT